MGLLILAIAVALTCCGSGYAHSLGCTYQHTSSYGSGPIKNSDFEYVFPEVPNVYGEFTVSIKGSGSAYLLLSPTFNLTDDATGDLGAAKIVLGAEGNNKTGFICNSHGGTWKNHTTPDVLSETNFREYHVTFTPGHVDIGVVGDFREVPLYSEDVDCLRKVKYIGIASGDGHSAHWRFRGYPAIKLVGGFDKFEGRVMYHNGNSWFDFYQTSFTLNEGNVACRELGFPEATDAGTNSSQF
ncbi:uncharacterized protein [Amphiura filiformis]|uniref:uncharacterized protein n=1 Tax=Amphiura filiformis TaxID=82378 RepID=UPI003B21DE3E